MDWWYERKTRRTVLRITSVVMMLVVVILLYVWYQRENLSEYQQQNTYLQPEKVDSASSDSTSSPDMRVIVQKEIDSIKKASGSDSQFSSYIQVETPKEEKKLSASVPVTQPKKINADSSYVKNEKSGSALQGPSAVFSHAYTIAVGKTVPVNILWQDADAQTTGYKLITIKVNDISDGKAKFTIEDPFNVLLFSQTGYGVKDKITIADEKHDINLLVQQVTNNSVIVNLVSHLNEKIVGKLQRVK